MNWSQARSTLAIAAAILPLWLSGCLNEPQRPSAESRFLQDEVVPAMNAWSKTHAGAMPLHKSATAGSFDYLCVVPEYQKHSLIEAEVPQVTTYRGATGVDVPETRIALVGVKGDTAHVAYLRRDPLTLHISGSRRCVQARNAVLIRRPRAGTNLPWATLEERPG